MNIYKPEEMKDDAAEKLLLLNTAVDVQAVLQLLISKEIITKEELDIMREKVRSIPKYAAAYKYIGQQKATADLWEKDPQSYLKAILKAKMDGRNV